MLVKAHMDTCLTLIFGFYTSVCLAEALSLRCAYHPYSLSQEQECTFAKSEPRATDNTKYLSALMPSPRSELHIPSRTPDLLGCQLRVGAFFSLLTGGTTTFFT
jgi:hypothetical protein